MCAGRRRNGFQRNAPVFGGHSNPKSVLGPLEHECDYRRNGCGRKGAPTKPPPGVTAGEFVIWGAGGRTASVGDAGCSVPACAEATLEQ